jgi:hypothetical protein
MKSHELSVALREVLEREAVRHGKTHGEEAEFSFRAGFFNCQLEVMAALLREENYHVGSNKN